MDDAQFDFLVQESLDSLPEDFSDRLWNLAVLVRDEPTQQDLDSVGLGRGSTLLGLYTGVPLTRRGRHLSGSTPDVIILYKGPIERQCHGNDDCIRRQVYKTLVHEVAHYFGISDERIQELGW